MTTAHAPGSVTTIFAPTDDETGGSYGVSFATDDGVTASVSPAHGGQTTVRLDGEATGFAPVEGVLDRLNVDAVVTLEAAVPVGAGFGASGAATLATALAANEAFGLEYDRDDLVEAAARAEIAAGTGLGDVYVQDRGGLVWDVGDGRTGATRTDRVSYASFGGIATGEVLGDDAAMARIREAGRESLDRFDPGMSLSALFALSWPFAERTGLVTDRVRDAVDRVEDAGGVATMAMVGETAIATGADGTLPNETRITPDGARVL